MSSCTRRAHPTSYQLSKDRDIDVWHRWYLEFGTGSSFKDISTQDIRIERKIFELVGQYSPNMHPSDCSIVRGSVDGKPLIRISIGVFHQVPYYQWRAPCRVEGFQDLSEDKVYVWRRSPSKTVRDFDSFHPKNWLRASLPLPLDGLVKHLALNISKDTNCCVHLKVLDSQWFLGGPGVKVGSSRELQSHRRRSWFRRGRSRIHSSVWTASPKMLVEFISDSIMENQTQQRRIMRFVLGVLRLHIGSSNFLRAARVEMKGRIDGHSRKKKMVSTVGFGDSFVSSSCWVRSSERDISTKKGLIHVRVTFFYDSFSNETKDLVSDLSSWLSDSSVKSDKVFANELTGLRNWLHETSNLLRSWQKDSHIAPSPSVWNYSKETLHQNLDLFRQRGLKRLGFWARHMESTKSHFNPGLNSWTSDDFRSWGRSMEGKSKSPFVRRIDEFACLRPSLLERTLPKVLEQMSLMERSSLSNGSSNRESYKTVPFLSSIANFPNVEMLEDYQLNKASIFYNRRQRYQTQFLTDFVQSNPRFSSLGFSDISTLSENIKAPWWFNDLEDLHRNRVMFKQNTSAMSFGRNKVRNAFYLPWRSMSWQNSSFRLEDSFLPKTGGQQSISKKDRISLSSTNRITLTSSTVLVDRVSKDLSLDIS